MAKRGSCETHYFYCMNCGQHNMDLPRKLSKQKERFHRKRLYCIHCREECDNIECKDSFDVEDFLKDYKNGVYKDEAEASLAYVRRTRQR